MTGSNHIRTCMAAMAAGAAAYVLTDRGIAAYAGLWSRAGTWPAAADLGCAAALGAFGSLLPDIDSRSSALGRYARLPFGHRTWTHSIWAVAAVLALAEWLPVPGARGLAFGYILHLIMDSLSSMGVCWLYPFRRYVYMDHGTWRKGSGGHGPKTAEGHRLKLYRTGRPDAGRRYTVTDGRTGKRWLTDGAVRLGFECLCVLACLACLASRLGIA